MDDVGRNAPRGKRTRHELGVLDRRAERERADAPHIHGAPTELLDDQVDAHLVARVEGREVVLLVAVARPAHLREVGARRVGDPVVLERNEELPVERVP